MGRTVLSLALLTCLLMPAGSAMGKEPHTMGEMKISSQGFEHNGFIPKKYTCDGADVNPQLVIDHVPPATRSLALIVDDPDAPVGTWVHWVLWNIPARTSEIAESSVPEGAMQGKNDWHRNRYGGPCPPSGTHRYYFKLYALDTILSLGANTTKADLERAMQGHVLAQAEMIGLYKRK